MENKWKKIGKLATTSGLEWLCDPHATLHQNQAMQPELGYNYNQFINIVELKERATGKRGFAQFNGNDGQSLGVCVQADASKSDYDVYGRFNEEGQVVAVHIAFDGSEPV